MQPAAPPPRRPLPLAAVALGLLGIGAIGAAGVLFPPSVGELLSAAHAATPSAPAGPAACAAYAGSTTWGLCVRKEALEAPTLEAMVALCAGAGPWEGACRDSWVEAQFHVPSVDRGMLLRACGGEPDCAFKVLDHRPIRELDLALAECAQWARPYANDCAGHVLRRAYPLGPEEVTLLRRTGDDWTQPHLAAWVGATAACVADAQSSCEDIPSAEKARCEAFAAHLRRHPEACPVRGGADGTATGLHGKL
ncbi:MAG: hypothetical protein RL071_2706 [Pseudomonadota bacterium]|jgi:hypothetical protein